MQTNNRMFDDFARMTNSLLGVASGVRGELEGVIKARLQAMLSEMDLVPREEFDAVKAMAARARAEQEALQERVAALEAALAEKKGGTRSRKGASPASEGKES